MALATELLSDRQGIEDRVRHFAIGGTDRTIAIDLPSVRDGNDVILKAGQEGALNC